MTHTTAKLIRCAAVMAAACAWTACVTPRTYFAVTGPANAGPTVAQRYGATTVDVDLARGTDAEALMVPTFRDDLTHRLEQMLPAATAAPAAPPTHLLIRPLRGRTYEVTFTTKVADVVVDTTRTTPDLSESTTETVAALCAAAAGVGYPAGLCSMFSVVFLPSAFVGVGLLALSVCAIAVPTAMIGAWYGVRGVAEANATARAASFMGELLDEHVQKIRRADAQSAGHFSAPASADAAPESDKSLAQVREWFVGISDPPKGPLTVEEVRALVAAGTAAADTLVWKKGMEWTPLGKVPALKPPATPPPLPKPKAPPPLPAPAGAPPPLPGATPAQEEPRKVIGTP
jgi:hypothetical protein